MWGGFLRNVMFLSALVARVRAVSTTGKASTTLYGGCDGKAGKLV